jgi:hypothetical protein
MPRSRSPRIISGRIIIMPFEYQRDATRGHPYLEKGYSLTLNGMNSHNLSYGNVLSSLFLKALMKWE